MKELFKGKPEHYLTTGKTIEVDSSLIRNVDTNMNTVKQREKIEAMKRAEARVAELEREHDEDQGVIRVWRRRTERADARVAELEAWVETAIRPHTNNQCDCVTSADCLPRMPAPYPTRFAHVPLLERFSSVLISSPCRESVRESARV